MRAYDRDRLGELRQVVQETRPKLDPDNPWSQTLGMIEERLSNTLDCYVAPGRPEPVILGRKVRKLLVPFLCCDAHEVAEGMWGAESTASLFDDLATIGQHVAFVREVELGVVHDAHDVRRLKGAIDRKIDDVAEDLAGAVLRSGADPAARKEVGKWEKALRRLGDARGDCRRFLAEAKTIAAERVTVDA